MDYTLDDLIHNNIRNANDQVNIDWSADTMLPKNLKDQGFWRYEGSLTTPDCFEIVRWTVFEEPLVIKQQSWEDLIKSTGVTDEGLNTEARTVPTNYRNVLPLNGRKISYYKKSNVVTPSSNKKKFATKVAFGSLPMSYKDPLTGQMSTKLQQVQKILLCFGEDEKLCMFM